jgi:hypothetical protein
MSFFFVLFVNFAYYEQGFKDFLDILQCVFCLVYVLIYIFIIPVDVMCAQFSLANVLKKINQLKVITVSFKCFCLFIEISSEQVPDLYGLSLLLQGS